MQLDITIVIGFLVTFGSMIWKISELRRSLEKDISRSLDRLKEALLEAEAKHDLTNQRVDNELLRQSDRITSLHKQSTSKLKDLIDQQNQIVKYLRSCKDGSCDHEFFQRNRNFSKETIGDDE